MENSEEKTLHPLFCLEFVGGLIGILSMAELSGPGLWSAFPFWIFSLWLRCENSWCSMECIPDLEPVLKSKVQTIFHGLFVFLAAHFFLRDFFDMSKWTDYSIVILFNLCYFKLFLNQTWKVIDFSRVDIEIHFIFLPIYSGLIAYLLNNFLEYSWLHAGLLFSFIYSGWTFYFVQNYFSFGTDFENERLKPVPSKVEYVTPWKYKNGV